MRSILTVILLLTAAPALAQSSGRYTMHPAEGGGMLRLDTETGGVSLCRPATAGGQWQCDGLADERAQSEREIARLTRENEELRSAVRRLEELAGLPPDRGPPDRRADRPPGGLNLPTPQDVDRAMTYFNSMLKKFKEKLKELEDGEGKRSERL